VGLDGGHDPIQRRGLWRKIVEGLLYMFTQFGDAAVHHLFDEFFAGPEVVIDRRGLNLGVFGYIRESRPGKPFRAQDVRRGIEDAGTCAGGLGIGVSGHSTVRIHHRFSRHG